MDQIDVAQANENFVLPTTELKSHFADVVVFVLGDPSLIQL
jgi:hypothetical protein